MSFESDLHEQLFAMFIAESNSATYRMWEWNKEETMYGFINTIKSEYENCWEDRSVHESFMDSVLREVKGE